MAKKKNSVSKELEQIGRIAKNIGSSAGQSGRGVPNQKSNGSGKPVPHGWTNENTARAQTLPFSRSRLRRPDEYDGVGGKIQYLASNVGFIGDTVGSGENFAEEYRRWKNGEYAGTGNRSKIFKL